MSRKRPNTVAGSSLQKSGMTPDTLREEMQAAKLGTDTDDEEILELLRQSETEQDIFGLENDEDLLKDEPLEDEDAFGENGEMSENGQQGAAANALDAGMTGSDYYYAQIRHIPLLSKEEEHELAFRAKAGDKEAFDSLVQHNLRYAFQIACHYVGRGLSKDDLIQEANIGLMTAVKKYDPNAGYRFTTYATWWIRQKLTRAVEMHARAIRLPVHVVQDIQKLKKLERRYTIEHGENLDHLDETILRKTGWSKAKLQKLRDCDQEVVSLNIQIGHDEGDKDSELGDFVTDDKANVENQYRQSGLTEAFRVAFRGSLNDREQMVLAMRFGLDGEREHSLEEVGQMLGVTRERVRQIESKALRKLKNGKSSRMLQGFVEGF